MSPPSRPTAPSLAATAAARPYELSIGRRVRRRVAFVPAWVVLAALAVSTIYPLVFVTFTALRTHSDYVQNPVGLPVRPTLDNLVDAWVRARVGELVLNSLIVVTVSVTVAVAVACLCGFAFAHLRFPGRSLGITGILLLMILPGTVLLVPIFSMVARLDLLNTYSGVALVYASLTIPFSVYMMTAYFRGVPAELLEAAQIDGASTFRMFWSIALPLARPALLTLVTLNFLWHWNELLFASVLITTDTKRLLTVGLTILQGQNITTIPIMAAGLLMSLLPVLLVFSLCQRNLTEGLTAGALK